MEITKWNVDPVHSEIQFTVKHLMITTVTGHFREFNLGVETEGDDFTKASSIVFTADVNSITTNNEQRDTHLKSADFFSADQYREVKFVGQNFKESGGKYLLVGDLTIRDITKPVEVEVEYGGIITDPWGQKRAGFTVDGQINRKDFDLKWDAITEGGQVVVSNEIKLHCTIELVKQAGAEPVARKTTAKELEE